MSFRLTLTAKANGFVWLFFRSTYTTITTSRWVNFISPRRSFHILTNSNGVSNCVAASTKIVEQPSCGQRLLSTKITDENVPIVSYEEVKDLPNHPEKLLIDVREPLELRQHGEIPNCINIPREYSVALSAARVAADSERLFMETSLCSWRIDGCIGFE